MNDNVKIDYEKLVADYMQSLTTVLRGFHSGTGYRFLETWVHDEDEACGILGIIEAARDESLPHISIHLGSATLGKVDVEALKQHAGKMGKVTVEANGQGIDFEVSFVGAGGPLASAPKKFAAEQRQERAMRPKTFAAMAKPSDAASRISLKSASEHPIYAEALRSAAQSRFHEGELQPADNLVLIRSSREGITLSALVDPTRNIIRQAAHQGTESPGESGLMETLCGWIEHKPIIECNDHAVIFLEFNLRNRSVSRPVLGIMTPENADPMFALPTRLVRDLFAHYCQQTGFNNIKNYYDHAISERWKALSAEERILLLEDAVEHHPSGQGMAVLRMESPKRVVIGFTDEISASEKQGRLMVLEDHLQKTLERTLHLYVEPKVDQNKLRRLKEAAAI